MTRWIRLGKSAKPTIEFFYPPTHDKLREYPLRYIGYAYPVYKLVCFICNEEEVKNLQQASPEEEQQQTHTGVHKEGSLTRIDNEKTWKENHGGQDAMQRRAPWIVTLTYVCLHGVYRLFVALVKENNAYRCPVPRTYVYPCLAMAESLFWDYAATIETPFHLSYQVYHLLHNNVFGGLGDDSIVRKYVPRVMSLASVFVLGPLVDLFWDVLFDIVLYPVYKLMVVMHEGCPLSWGRYFW